MFRLRWHVTRKRLIERFISFLEGPKAALVNSADYENGHYTKDPQRGIRAFGRVYSAWAYGQTVGAQPTSQTCDPHLTDRYSGSASMDT